MMFVHWHRWWQWNDVERDKNRQEDRPKKKMKKTSHSYKYAGSLSKFGIKSVEGKRKEHTKRPKAKSIKKIKKKKIFSRSVITNIIEKSKFGICFTSFFFVVFFWLGWEKELKTLNNTSEKGTSESKYVCVHVWLFRYSIFRMCACFVLWTRLKPFKKTLTTMIYYQWKPIFPTWEWTERKKTV